MSERPITKKTGVPGRSSLIERWLARCAATFPMYGKTLADYPEKFEAFGLALSGLNPPMIDFAFQEAVKRLAEFPVPAQILEFAAEYQVPERREMERLPAKPDGWEPGITPEDTRRMLAEAIERQAPQVAMGRSDGQTLHQYHRSVALEHLGGSTMPVGLRGEKTIDAEMYEANREWAHDMAVKNGWAK